MLFSGHRKDMAYTIVCLVEYLAVYLEHVRRCVVAIVMIKKNHSIGHLLQTNYQTLVVSVSFWTIHGRVPKIAWPFTLSQAPRPRRRSSNIGRITPSAVGPIFINKFPAFTKRICINTSQSSRERIVAARKTVAGAVNIYLRN